MLHLRAEAEESFSVGKGIFLPAALAQHQFANCKVGMVRDLDLTDSRSDHDISDRYRGCVRGSVAHSAAHVGVKREADGSQKHLALDRHRDGLCLAPEIVGSGRSEWS